MTRVIGKSLEKDRNMRYQGATDLKTDLLRLKRDLDSGPRRTMESSETRRAGGAAAERSIAVLYFENLSGVKEDEYLRDGVTEDIITDLSKIKGLKIFSRSTVLSYRDKNVTPSGRRRGGSLGPSAHRMPLDRSSSPPGRTSAPRACGCG